MSHAQQVHGHEILRLVHAANPPLTRAQLTQEVRRRFGADARFCTCSAEGMTLEELVAFLLSRGKLIEQGGVVVADIGQMCGGEEPHHHEGE